MSTDELITEARARITWGDEPESVRAFLAANGLSVAEANDTIKQLMLERNAEVRKLGLRDLLIGLALLGAAGAYCYYLFTSSHLPRLSVRSARAYGVLALAGFYGLWRLVNGVLRLARPKGEHGSISDLSE